MAQIKDLVEGIQSKLAGRTDVPAKAPRWIQSAIRELSENYPFIELETSGAEAQLVAGERQVPVENFVTPGQFPTDIKFFELFIDYPANTRSVAIHLREPGVVIPLSRIPGLPKFCCRYGANILFGFCPDKAYKVIMYYQKRHEFAPALEETEILMPPDWLEILEYAAAEKGATELRLPDYVTMYHQLLHGDPQNAAEIGLLKAKVSQHAKDKAKNVGQIGITVSQY